MRRVAKFDAIEGRKEVIHAEGQETGASTYG